MRIRFLHDFVLVKPLPEATLYKGTIIIPEKSREIPAHGTVMAIGPGIRNERGELQPMDVKVGDRVVYRDHLGYELDLEGEYHRVLHESDLLGVEERSVANPLHRDALAQYVGTDGAPVPLRDPDELFKLAKESAAESRAK